ncbi:hypothetical protein QJS10_CPB14g00419 [Acorus calamus]|uniref:PB1 domain-containing protein n=1 Tax=Acorus calamus TaxID=4465 RepID=A0AAV9DCW1_ACOCL|nr:hypothetical protein QJS10_CPB14g00419 [Acorus calamus]
MDPTPPPPSSAYADSLSSSPHSSWDEPPQAPPPPSPPKPLRLMCSYGGHIVPRPHDKSLCYLGGDTRIVVFDRCSSLSDLSLKLSKSLLHGRHDFSLKYQLPNEDLDSLISLATDEDLDNMIDEYDRTLSHSSSRLRLFLFPSNPDSSSLKSESWFLNSNSSKSDSSSTSVDCLLPGFNSLDLKQTGDSPMVMETGSSFGSASSGLSNLSPIRVRPAMAEIGVEDYFTGLQMAEEHRPPPPPMVVGGTPSSSSISPTENPSRVFSDDERSVDQVRKVTPPTQVKSGNLESPAPDSSINRPGFREEQVTSMGPRERTSPAAVATTVIAASANTIPDPKREIPPDPYRIPIQIQDPNYGLPIQPEQQQQPPVPQFIHTGPPPHYIPHHAPVTSYYHPVHPQHQHQPLDQPTYPVYYVPARPPYNLAMPPNLAEFPHNKPTTYYPPRPIPPRPEMGSSLYRTAAAAAAAAQAPPSTGQFMYSNQLQNMSHLASNFGYEQVYYTPASLPPQYQTVTSAMMMSDTIALQPSDPKQNRTST